MLIFHVSPADFFIFHVDFSSVDVDVFHFVHVDLFHLATSMDVFVETPCSTCDNCRVLET